MTNSNFPAAAALGLNPTDYTARVSIDIHATPADIFALVTDIARTGEWSPVCQTCWWKDPATGPAEGAWFIGRNVTPTRTWETESLVTSYLPNEAFTWAVGGGIVEWGYLITPNPDADDNQAPLTTLTETWTVTNDGFAFFTTKYGQDAAAQLADRRDAALSGIPQTLERIKAILEHGSQK